MGQGLPGFPEISRRLQGCNLFPDPFHSIGLGRVPAVRGDPVPSQVHGDGLIAPNVALGADSVDLVGDKPRCLDSGKDAFRSGTAIQRHKLRALACFGGHNVIAGLQGRDHLFDSLRVEVRKVKVNVIQLGRAFDPPRKGGADHAAKQLRDVGMILRTAEGHHHFGAGAVPAGRKCHLEEHHRNVRVIIDAGRIDVADNARAFFQPALVHQGMGKLCVTQRATDAILHRLDRV